MTQIATQQTSNHPQSIHLLERIYGETITRYAGKSALSGCKVVFYPYVGIDSRIRVRNQMVYVRISDLLQNAPLEFHRALANILVLKLLRRKPAARDLEIYKEFVTNPQIRRSAESIRRKRGRKFTVSSTGENHDLSKTFDFLNSLYFRGSIAKPKLSWSRNATFRSLGHHDAAHDTIIISSTLDQRGTPRFVLEFVLFHEMLHIKHPAKVINGRTYYHTKEFRADEKLFPYFHEAEEWILKNVSRFRRAAKKNKSAGLKHLRNF